MTGHGRHAAGRRPNPAVPVFAAVILLAVAAGGWLLFAQPTRGVLIAGALENARFPEPVAAAAEAGPVPLAKTAVPPPVRPQGLPRLLPKTAEGLRRLAGPVARLNWPAVARCESRNDPRAVSRGRFFGLYQFSEESWRAVGGAGLPHQADRGEQTLRAQLLYKKVDGRWERQWPRCGQLLFLS